VKIIVCIKVVLDPEAPASLFQVDAENKKVIPPKGTPPVLNPFDENALEAALRIKDSKGAFITVLSMGKNIPKTIIRKCLAVGADKLILAEDNAFDDLDSYSPALILAAAIKKIGEYDLVLCGRQSSDTDAGLTGAGIAEMLGLPCVTEARKIEVKDDKSLKIEKTNSDGYAVISSNLPGVITASNEIGELRSAALPAIIASQKKEITVWNASDLGIDIAQLKKPVLLKLFQPIRENKCEMIAGKTPEETGANLIQKLREAKII
jgi:electron transfer flavoprotein beta subunit